MLGEDLLPSWRDGVARTALVEFLARADEIPPDERIAVFDNDGTLWCEKPRYAQLDFFVWVVGTLVTYELQRRDGRPVLLRTRHVEGATNEGAAKILNIQVGLGRRPALAAGNSPGDAEMLEYTSTGDGPRLALLVDHDDAAREYAYRSEAATFSAAESITATAARLGWTRVSMRDDWATVFPED